MKKSIFCGVNFLILLFGTLLTACSNNDYTRALPTASTALIYVDADKSGGAERGKLLEHLLRIESVGDGGLDFSQRIYFFEMADGSAGMPRRRLLPTTTVRCWR